MFIRKDILEYGKDEKSLFVFLHFQRTGGSNFQRWLATVFPYNEIYNAYTEGFVHWHVMENISSLNQRKVFAGFSNFKHFDTARPLIFMGNVRHPVYRIVSLMHLAKLSPKHFLHDLSELDTRAFYRRGRERTPTYFDNLQTRRMAGGKVNIDQAIENIRSNFGIVGTTAGLHATSKLLTDFYNWPVEPMPQTEGAPDELRYASRIDADLYQEIAENNAADIQLFDFIRQQEPHQSSGEAREKSASPTGAHVPAVSTTNRAPDVTITDCTGEPVYSCTPKTYSVPMLNLAEYDRIVLEISVPPIPDSLRACYFAEHVLDATGEPTEEIVIVGEGKIGISHDMGKSWTRIELPGNETTRFHSCFTTQSGRHIVQAIGWQGMNDTPEPEDRHARMFIFSPDWSTLEGSTKAGFAQWHGSASIAEKNGTIMYAEYNNNSAIYRRDLETSGLKSTVRACAIWRSRDDGFTWEKVFEKSPAEIRHLHTVVADPFEVGVWWASSGDLARESRIWRSGDDGDTWQDCTDPAPDISVPKSYANKKGAAHRQTDTVILPDEIIWGTDDLMGDDAELAETLPRDSRAGSRIYRSRKSSPLKIRECGYIGQHIRNIIDVGKGWIIATEGNRPSSGYRAALFFADRTFDMVTKICDLDNFRNRPTVLTFSRASRKHRGGRFFSFKSTSDLYESSPRIAEYRISFVDDE